MRIAAGPLAKMPPLDTDRSGFPEALLIQRSGETSNDCESHESPGLSANGGRGAFRIFRLATCSFWTGDGPEILERSHAKESCTTLWTEKAPGHRSSATRIHENATARDGAGTAAGRGNGRRPWEPLAVATLRWSSEYID
jgi:hypothetical protein